MSRVEVIQGGIPYKEVSNRFIKDDELLMAEMEGKPIPPDFKIGAWLADEIVGETALAILKINLFLFLQML